MSELQDAVRQALVDADAIGDPDQLDYYAESVVQALSQHEGWLIRPGGAWPIQELRDSWADDGNRFWELITVDYEQD